MSAADLDLPSEGHLSRPLGDCVVFPFPTPVVVHDWPGSEALNQQLRVLILAAELASPGVARSNVGGWHSDQQFLDRRDPCVQALLRRIRLMTQELTRAFMPPRPYSFAVVGWANILRAGDYNAVHTHPNAMWSGVYYVTGNPEPPGTEPAGVRGRIELYDPRPGAAASYTLDNDLQRNFTYNPRAGAMLVFPSWVPHFVHAHRGSEPRISVAFNVTVS